MNVMRASGEAATERVHGLFIGGEWVSGSDVFEVRNPYDAAWVANVAEAAAAQERDEARHDAACMCEGDERGRKQRQTDVQDRRSSG